MTAAVARNRKRAALEFRNSPLPRRICKENKDEVSLSGICASVVRLAIAIFEL
jgi:hypothetical protein